MLIHLKCNDCEYCNPTKYYTKTNGSWDAWIFDEWVEAKQKFTMQWETAILNPNGTIKLYTTPPEHTNMTYNPLPPIRH